MTEWLTPSTLISALALAISGIGLAYTRKIELRQSKSDQPTVSVDLTEYSAPSWYRIAIEVRNRTDSVWVLESLSIPNWESARVGFDRDIIMYDDGGSLLGLNREAALFDRVPLDQRIPAGGTDGPGAITSHLLLSVERGLQGQSINLEIRLRSLAEIRPITIHVARSIAT